MALTPSASTDRLPHGGIPTRCLVLALLLAVCLPVSAETHYKPHISVGGRAGVTMARADISPSARQSWLMASGGSVTFRYAEEKIFGLVAELGWCQRGWKENFEEAPINYSRTLTYLQLPVMTHINFGSRRAKGFINLGPEVSYMVGEKISADFDYRNPTADSRFPTSPRQTAQMSMAVKNRFDYGITAGLGGEFFINPRNSVTIEARFYYGLGNIFPATVSDTFSASRLMNLEVTLGYWFRLR